MLAIEFFESLGEVQHGGGVRWIGLQRGAITHLRGVVALVAEVGIADVDVVSCVAFPDVGTGRSFRLGLLGCVAAPTPEILIGGFLLGLFLRVRIVAALPKRADADTVRDQIVGFLFDLLSL